MEETRQQPAEGAEAPPASESRLEYMEVSGLRARGRNMWFVPHTADAFACAPDDDEPARVRCSISSKRPGRTEPIIFEFPAEEMLAYAEMLKRKALLALALGEEARRAKAKRVIVVVDDRDSHGAGHACDDCDGRGRSFGAAIFDVTDSPEAVGEDEDAAAEWRFHADPLERVYAPTEAAAVERARARSADEGWVVVEGGAS